MSIAPVLFQEVLVTARQSVYILRTPEAPEWYSHCSSFTLICVYRCLATLCVCAPVLLRPPGTRATDGYKPPCGDWELDKGTLRSNKCSERLIHLQLLHCIFFLLRVLSLLISWKHNSIPIPKQLDKNIQPEVRL